MKLLLAEDTRDVNRAITVLLKHEKYEIDAAYDGEEALEYLKTNGYDCIILDIMMPKIDGLSVLKELRQRHILTPVLLLTAKAEIEDRVFGLDAGADDYLPKPFDSKELLARVRTLIRRQSTYSAEEFRVGDIVLDTRKFSLSSVNSVSLSNKEFELMFLLMSNTDIDLSSSFILEHIWKNEPEAQQDTVWLYISYLRRKLSLINSEMTISSDIGCRFRLSDGKIDSS